MHSESQAKGTLRARVIRAGAWVLTGHMASQVIRLAGNLIMTRLLVPEMFGVMAVANVLIVGMALFSDFGLSQNIIQSSRGNDSIFLNTAWTAQIVRGLFISLLSLLMAYLITVFGQLDLLAANTVYSDKTLPFIIAVLSLVPLINGLESTKTAVANRNIQLGIISRMELYSQLVGLTVMIAWALVHSSIWALVAGAITTSLVKTLCSHFLLPGRLNKICWNKEVLHELFHFGKWMILNSLLVFLTNNGDRLLMGGLADADLMGQYAIAVLIVGAIRMVIDKFSGSVALPTLSEVYRNSPEKLVHVYHRIRKPIDIFTYAVSGYIFVTGSYLVDFLFDDRYKMAGPMLEVLCIELVFIRYAVSSQCFVAMGRPKILVPAIALRILAMFALLPVLYRSYGMSAALWVVACSRFVSLPYLFYMKWKYGFLSIGHELRYLPVFPLFILLGLVSISIYRMIL